MKTDTKVETKHEEIEIVAHAKSCAESHLAPEILESEDSILSTFVFEGVFQIPHVSGIEEQCAIQSSEDIESIFEIGLQFDVANTVEICIFGIIRTIAPWTDTPHRESTDTVGSTHIE